MIALLFVLAGLSLGCLTILFSVAFSIAARSGATGMAYSHLISASAFMVLGVTVSVAAERMM